VLIFEDDAKPLHDDWMEWLEGKGVQTMVDLDLDVLSLHGRQLTGLTKVPYAFPVYVTNPSSWVVSSMVYLLHDRACAGLISREFNGVPIDMYLKSLKMGVIDPSPFSHENGQASLIDR